VEVVACILRVEQEEEEKATQDSNIKQLAICFLAASSWVLT
jgi:hypothetical protein